jgi:beta-glucanase (GH16 family)
MPHPVCKDRTTKFDNLDRVQDISKFLGDPKTADWVSQGEPVINDGTVLLTMPKGSVGTVISSTDYMWYGNVKARMKTSRGRGVVTAFILFSDVKDEIDYEWVGVDLETAQTNYYFQGITNYTNSENITDLSDSFKNWHDYEMRWTPDKIDWVVDGKTERTVERKYTFNATSNQYEFPQTPARVQLSLWPGGLASNAKGTIDWAGGEIDWNAADIQDPGFFYASVDSVEVECYSASSGAGTNKNKSYSYDNLAGTNDTVVDGDKDTVLGSLMASGLDPDVGKKKEKESKSKDSSTKTDSEEKPKNTAAQIPGGGSVGQDHSDEGDSSDDSGNDNGSGGSSGGDGGDSGSAPANTADCDVSSFHADCNGDKSSSSESSKDGDGEGSAPRAGASALAVIIAACALFWL